MVKLRKQTRLPGYDYSTPGGYFVTMCTDFMQCIFGNITDGAIRLNEFGTIAHNCWEKVPTHFPEAELDIFQVMPNHVHAILLLGDRSHKLGHIIGSYKAAVTKRIHELPGNSNITVWERSFYDHIVRDEDSLSQIRRYITNNPLKWELDRYHPTRKEIRRRMIGWMFWGRNEGAVSLHVAPDSDPMGRHYHPASGLQL